VQGAQGNKTAAAAYFEQAIQLDPNGQMGQSARRALGAVSGLDEK
jgi:hypothetical protein